MHLRNELVPGCQRFFFSANRSTIASRNSVVNSIARSVDKFLPFVSHNVFNVIVSTGVSLSQHLRYMLSLMRNVSKRFNLGSLETRRNSNLYVQVTAS